MHLPTLFYLLIDILCPLSLFIACVFKNINKLGSGMRAHQNTWGRVSQVRNLGQERDKEVQSFHGIWGSGKDASRCADEHWQFWHACALVFPAGRSEQMIMTSQSDVMRISPAIEGGNYKRTAPLSPRAVIWVF